tara:strand:- start:693 stop:938 length:246 start_codon:yes stop_codon:yes gene_type:complete
MTEDNLKRAMIVGAEIDHIVESHPGIKFIEACVIYCDKYEIEVESLGEVLKQHQNIVSKIRDEAEDLNYIKKDPCMEIEFE